MTADEITEIPTIPDEDYEEIFKMFPHLVSLNGYDSEGNLMNEGLGYDEEEGYGYGEEEGDFGELEEEYDEEEGQDNWTDDMKQAGGRIFVLTPQGETLQVWKPPPRAASGTEPPQVSGFNIFGRKLLVRTPHTGSPTYEFLALKGI